MGPFAWLFLQKSHAHDVDQPTTDSEWAAWLNNQADQAAMQGARLHGASAALVAGLEDRLAKIRKYLRRRPSAVLGPHAQARMG